MIFLNDTLADDDASPYCLTDQRYCPGQTFTEVQNLHCDLDLEYSKVTFSQDTPAYEHALSN